MRRCGGAFFWVFKTNKMDFKELKEVLFNNEKANLAKIVEFWNYEYSVKKIAENVILSIDKNCKGDCIARFPLTLDDFHFLVNELNLIAEDVSFSNCEWKTPSHRSRSYFMTQYYGIVKTLRLKLKNLHGNKDNIGSRNYSSLKLEVYKTMEYRNRYEEFLALNGIFV